MVEQKKYKVGDYVENNWVCAGVEPGEQGVIIDAENQNHIQVIFPARTDSWAEHGWVVGHRWLKLVYRPKGR